MMKNSSDQKNARRPKECPTNVVAEKSGPGETNDSRHRLRHGVKSRQELGNQQRAGAALHEQVFSVLDARIRLQRNAAEQAKNLGAPPTAQLIPHQVAEESSRKSQNQQDWKAHLAFGT